MSNPFPTRQYPYRRDGGGAVQLSAAGSAGTPVLAPDTLYRFIVGLDDAGLTGPPVPRPLGSDEANTLNDPFAQLLRQTAPHPLAARRLVAALEPAGMQRQSFVIGEGLQIPWSAATAHMNRQLRVAVAWTMNNNLAVLLSTAPSFDDEKIFLQVIGWDAAARQFNFYERRLGVWSFAGNSHHALAAPTRGRGPFDSHVNGAMVMKELKAPWLHWSSMAAFELPGIAPDDPLRQEPLFAERAGAQRLETLVRSSVLRWTEARLDAVTGSGFDALPFMRHLLTSTTVNLVSSAQQGMARPAGGRLQLPPTPFFDANLLLDQLGIEIQSGSLSAAWEDYQTMLGTQGYMLGDQDGTHTFPGDTHFAFPAFERSIEDQQVVAGLLKRGMLPARVAACLAMVDFPNPVWSARRAALLKYVAPTASRTPEGWDLGDRIVAAIQASAGAPGSPEAEFMDLWNTGDGWAADFGGRLDRYLQALQRDGLKTRRQL